MGGDGTHTVLAAGSSPSASQQQPCAGSGMGARCRDAPGMEGTPLGTSRGDKGGPPHHLPPPTGASPLARHWFPWISRPIPGSAPRGCGCCSPPWKRGARGSSSSVWQVGQRRRQRCRQEEGWASPRGANGSPFLPGCSVEGPLDDTTWARSAGKIRDLRLCGRHVSRSDQRDAGKAWRGPAGTALSAVTRHRKLFCKSL